MVNPELARGLPSAVQVLVVGVSLLPGLWWSVLGSEDRQRLLAAVGMSALLSGPLLATYHLVLVLPLLALGADQLHRQGYGSSARFVLFFGLLLAWWPVPSAWPESSWMIWR